MLQVSKNNHQLGDPYELSKNNHQLGDPYRQLIALD